MYMLGIYCRYRCKLE